MDVSTVKSQIKSKNINHFYIFAGVEWAVQKVYINQLANVIGADVLYVDSLAEVFPKIRNKSFVWSPKCYVIRDDKDFMSDEKAQSAVTNLGEDVIVILILTSIDKRTKFYKKYKEDIVIFDPLKPDILKKYLKQHIQLSDKNFDTLMEICEYDYGRCLLEVDKITMYDEASHMTPTSENEAFEILLKEGVIYRPPKDAIFDFANAVLSRKPKLSWELYHECKAVGEATLVMLSVIYNNVKQVLQVQTAGGKDVGKTTGLTGWQIKSAYNHLRKYDDWELEDAMILIQKIESGIKRGKIEESIAVDYLLINML